MSTTECADAIQLYDSVFRARSSSMKCQSLSLLNVADVQWVPSALNMSIEVAPSVPVIPICARSVQETSVLLNSGTSIKGIVIPLSVYVPFFVAVRFVLSAVAMLINVLVMLVSQFVLFVVESVHPVSRITCFVPFVGTECPTLA